MKQLRTGVARDRIAYLDDLVKQVASHSLKQPAALYKAIRRAFPTAKRQDVVGRDHSQQ